MQSQHTNQNLTNHRLKYPKPETYHFSDRIIFTFRMLLLNKHILLALNITGIMPRVSKINCLNKSKYIILLHLSK